MQTILKAMGNASLPEIKPILEINPGHSIVQKMESISDETVFNDVSLLLFEQAMLIEGMKLESPADFVKRMNSILTNAL
jgi:molecular chaperone HtpG